MVVICRVAVLHVQQPEYVKTTSAQHQHMSRTDWSCCRDMCHGTGLISGWTGAGLGFLLGIGSSSALRDRPHAWGKNQITAAGDVRSLSSRLQASSRSMLVKSSARHQHEAAEFGFSLSVMVTMHGLLIKACHTVLPAQPWQNQSACLCVPWEYH